MKNVTPLRNTGKPSEAQFENTLVTLYGQQCYIYRIEDAADLHGMNGRVIITSKKPSDYVVTIKGLTMMAEVKSSISKTSFSFSCLKDNQIHAAKRMQLANGKYMFFVHCLDKDTFHLLSPELLFTTLASGRKSLRWEELPVWEDYENYKRLSA